MTVAALVAGCTVVMKPAEQTPLIAARLHALLVEAGIPAAAVQFLPGVGETVGPVLVRHPATAVIAFTGSRAVGLAIARAAAETPGAELKQVVTELGGKNAIIVDDDADLDEAVAGVVASAFGYQGQKCSACSRAIVLDAVHDAFLDRLVATVRGLPIGPAADPGNAIGPLIDAEARDRVLAAIARGRGEARLVHAGDIGALGDEGFYVAPHLFADVPPGSSLAQEEIFGPVLAVLRARDLDHALALANGTRYALTGGCYSRSPATLDRVRRDFQVGNLYLNRGITGALVDRQPFGGFRHSGTGPKAGGPDYLLRFLTSRCISENTLRHGFTPDPDAALS
jgi:RHH-type proline utilization regulon transcriptional repressor/proline dehydrogenase/delta 1-pyrroline-5-carboxylate dehydrogenase